MFGFFVGVSAYQDTVRFVRDNPRGLMFQGLAILISTITDL